MINININKSCNDNKLATHLDDVFKLTLILQVSLKTYFKPHSII